MTKTDKIFNILIGGSLKKYNKVDLNGVFVWIILPILLFLFSMNSVYAYFTATASDHKADVTTGTISIEFQGTEKSTTSKNSTKVVDGKVLPGDTLTYTGTLVNTGTIRFYCILEFDVKISEAQESLIHSYYTGYGVALVKNASGVYTTGATAVASKGTTNFTLSYLVPTDFKLSDYANKTIIMTVTAHAIQYDHVNSVDRATKLLLGEST